jgi:hypothetical protein
MIKKASLIKAFQYRIYGCEYGCPEYKSARNHTIALTTDAA